ncbi:MAG: hypothetical protein WCO63_13055 [Bacteroidota bacterium]
MPESLKENELLKLLNTDSSRVIADLICDAVDKNPELFGSLVQMSFNQPYPAGMRAARAIQIYCLEKPDVMIPYLEEIITNILESKTEGIRRNYLQVLAQKIDLNILEEPGSLISQCFDWLADSKVKPATRIYAAEVIKKFCNQEPDLKRELIDVLEFAMEECPVSLRGRGRKILAALSKPQDRNKK